MKLVYVFDAYCGWSHGFSATLREIASRHPELPVEVVSGGLFTGPRQAPIRTFGYVQGANATISEVTGAEFGDGYERLIADGSFVMDSEAAARGTAALRLAAPDRVVELATALQRAFYVDGHSLSDADTYRTLAEAAGLVRRVEDPGDRRGRLVRLTPQGEQTAVTASRVHVQNIRRYFLEPLPVEDRERFTEDLRILSHSARDMLPRLP